LELDCNVGFYLPFGESDVGSLGTLVNSKRSLHFLKFQKSAVQSGGISVKWNIFLTRDIRIQGYGFTSS
jgi:hypothetical protein